MKFKTFIIRIIFFLILSCSFFLSIHAKENFARIVDKAELLTDEAKNKLESKLDEISKRQKFDVVVVTINSLNGKTSTNFADDFYDFNGYGFGLNHDGVLLLVSINDKEWSISTSGYGTTALNDTGIKYISKKFLPSMKDKKYEEAFLIYANLVDEFITQAKTGRPYDSSNLPKDSFKFIKFLCVSTILGAIVSYLITSKMKHNLKSVKSAKNACSYIDSEKFSIDKTEDLFLYNNITKTLKTSSTNSTTHKSSSGNAHGGSSGKF